MYRRLNGEKREQEVSEMFDAFWGGVWVALLDGGIICSIGFDTMSVVGIDLMLEGSIVYVDGG